MKNLHLSWVGLAAAVCLAPVCGLQKSEKQDKPTRDLSDQTLSKQMPYSFNSPQQTVNLPFDLNEISGLSTTSNPDELAAIHDELGEIFFIDKKTGAILRRTQFTADGDFEGIEWVEKDLFVVKSKGSILKISNVGTPQQTVEKWATSLTKSDNIEGLGYDPIQKHLLLAAKGQKTGELVKKIYRFDIAKKQILGGEPISISLTDFQDFLKKKSGKTYEKLQSDYSNATDNLELGPSAIAVHPKTGEWYLVSSINKILMRLDAKGNILDIVKLDKQIHRQPEGLCFDQNGTLFIANEAKDGNPPTLLIFTPK